MNLRTSVLFVVLIIQGLAFSSTHPASTIVNVRDTSAIDAPLKISGTVEFNDDKSGMLPYGVNMDIALSNASAKSIVMSIVRVDLSSQHIQISHSEEDDYFFQSAILESKSKSLLQLSSPIGRSIAPYNSAPVQPTATGRVIFVQFSDGTSWGDPTASERAITNRTRSLQKLESLSELYRNGPEQDFLSDLLKSTDLQPVLTLQNLFNSHGDTRLVSEKITEMLENARKHTESMRKATLDK